MIEPAHRPVSGRIVVAALAAALAADVPTVIDVVTDPEAYPPVTNFDGRLGGI